MSWAVLLRVTIGVAGLLMLAREIVRLVRGRRSGPLPTETGEGTLIRRVREWRLGAILAMVACAPVVLVLGFFQAPVKWIETVAYTSVGLGLAYGLLSLVLGFAIGFDETRK